MAAMNRSMKFDDLVMKALIVEEESGDKLYDVGNRLTGETYALKELSTRRYNTSDLVKIHQEIEVLKKLNHPYLVKIHEIFEVDDKIYLLLEHVTGGGSLVGGIADESSLANVAFQVLLGLDYLHSTGIHHGDVKVSNFFTNSLNQVKLLYLGRILSKTTSIEFALTVGVLFDKYSWDVWNLGLTILKLYKGSYWGYEDNDFGEVFDSEDVFGSTPTAGTPSKYFWNFVLCCMSRGLNRPTAKKLLHHPFIEPHYRRLGKDKMDLPALSRFLSRRKQKYQETNLALSLAFGTTSSRGRVEQVSPLAKKPKISSDDKNIFHLESSRDPTRTVYPESSRYSTQAIYPHSVSNSPSSAFHNLQDHSRFVQYFSLFPQDYEFEREKLVQLWIAEDCVNMEATKRMEDVANFHFDLLVHEEVITPSKLDHLYGRMKYKVNPSKASTWLVKGGHEYLIVDEHNLSDIHGPVLHLSFLHNKFDQALFDALKNCKQLRTLLMLSDCGASIKQLASSLFPALKLLRTLDLSFACILELPSSIALLESLRFLDISETPIKLLTESIDRLNYLQTLRLRGCFGIHALPKELKRLVNLRHLDLDIVRQLKSMPKGMGSLVNLQTLQAFIVGKSDGCGIGELKNMNDITGSFCISRLENVSNAFEAEEAAIGKKKYIDKLELRWHGNSPIDFEILQSLQPHFGLKELQILFYSGSELPSWITNPSFTALASITLYNCINCLVLPSIGQLPSLKCLRIVGMNSLRDINSIFCRKNGPRTHDAFPKLEKLTLDNMLNLESWSGLEKGDFPCLLHVSIRYCPNLYVLPALSHLYSLLHLEISHCMQLSSLPEGGLPSSLESLIIRDCPRISERCAKDEGEDWSKIAHLRNIWIDFKEISLD